MMKRLSRLLPAGLLIAGLFLIAPSPVGAANDAAPARMFVCHQGRLLTVGAIGALWHVMLHGDIQGSCVPPGGL